jgi:hypothetical protein
LVEQQLRSFQQWHEQHHHHAAHGKFILPVVKIELFQFCRALPQSSLIYQAAAMLRRFVLAIGGSAPAGAGVVVESAGDDERNQICALPCRHPLTPQQPAPDVLPQPDTVQCGAQPDEAGNTLPV